MSDITLARQNQRALAGVADRLLSLTPSWLAPPTTGQDVLAVASHRTGLPIPSDLPGREALDALAADMAEEDLSALGQRIASEVMVTGAENALRLAHWSASHPGVDPGDDAPVVIVGLHRTGTTLLHRLLAEGGELQAGTYWEYLRPVPDQSHRVRQADGRRAAWLARWMSPELEVVHPIDWRGPEECWVAMQAAFGAYGFTFHYRLPRYREALVRTRMAPAYTAYRRILGALAHDRQDGRRWVLKCPEHLPFLDAVIATFPRARIVWTHRDPSVATASFASLSAIQRRLLRGRYEPERTGREVQAAFASSLETGMEIRERLEPERILDVDYRQLVSAPREIASHIHRWADLPNAEQAAERGAHWLDARTSAGPHRYSAGWFGLDAEPEIFDAYRQRFLL